MVSSFSSLIHRNNFGQQYYYHLLIQPNGRQSGNLGIWIDAAALQTKSFTEPSNGTNFYSTLNVAKLSSRAHVFGYFLLENVFHHGTLLIFMIYLSFASGYFHLGRSTWNEPSLRDLFNR